MIALYVPLSLTQVTDTNGAPIRTARLYVYVTGTTTPKDVFQDGYLDPTRKLPWPVPVDATGRLPAVFVGIGNYDVVVTNGTSPNPVGAPGAVLYSAIDLPGDPSPGTTPAFDPLRQFQTGAIGFFVSSGGQNGWVPANGGTIGSENSGASVRADADCKNLFRVLWEGRPDLNVSPGRGSDADSDFAAGNTIALPDLNSRLLAFVAPGSPSGNLFSGGLVTLNPGTLLGSAGGEAVHQLTPNELAKHAHLASFSGDPIGNHTHIADVGVESDTHEHSLGTKRYVILSAGGDNQTVTSFYAVPDGDTGPVLSATGGENRQHIHPVTNRPAGAFTPTGSVTVYDTGIDTPHNNLPPFAVAGAVFIKL